MSPEPSTPEPEQARHPRIDGPPHRLLRPWLARDHAGFTAATEPTHLVLPASASVSLVLKVQDSPHRPPEFTGGVRGAPLPLDGACSPSYVEVRLTPLGAYAVLGLPMDELRGRIVALDDIVGAEGRRLGEVVRDAGTWRRRFALVDDFLLRRLDEGRARPAPEVSRVWQRLVATAGAVPIGQLAGEVGWSHRHLIRQFRRQVGLGPKTAARLVRFDRVLDRLERGGPDRWADVAADAGYADQAHLIRDFHTFAGTSPTRFASQLRAA
jgi:AraC-like DNA-binding protein